MSIKFKNNEYDPFIDYIKGTCIIFVIWTHCFFRDELDSILFPFWGDNAVPLFLLIQVFHFYKKENSNNFPSIKKLWKRIILPFIILMVFTFSFDYFIYFEETSGKINIPLYWNNRGPGSYYIFIYIQFTFLLPIIRPILSRLSLKWLCLLFIIVSHIFEFSFCVISCPDAFFRITFFRYTFLIFMGYLLAKKGIPFNKTTLMLSAISMVFIYLFNYTTYDWGYLFCTTFDNWSSCHWVCYIYITILFLYIIKILYHKLGYSLKTGIENIGKYSYEIYLFQMFYFAIIKRYVKVIIFGYDAITYEILFLIITTVICLSPSMILYNYNKHHRHTHHSPQKNSI